jgi:hypothetical protein
MTYVGHLNEVKNIAWNVFNLKILVSDIHLTLKKIIAIVSLLFMKYSNHFWAIFSQLWSQNNN